MGGITQLFDKCDSPTKICIPCWTEGTQKFLLCRDGLDFATADGIVQVHQHSYTDNLQLLHMQAANAIQRDAPLNKTEKEQLRSKIGQILWIAKQTRPDVMFSTCSLASNLKNAMVQSIHEVKSCP